MRKYREIKDQSDKYLLQLNNGEIFLTPYYQYKTCSKCKIDKLATRDFFYLKYITKKDDFYIPHFDPTCKVCLINKQKKSGRFFNIKEFEKATNSRKCNKCDFIKDLNENNFRFVKNIFNRYCLVCERDNAIKQTKKRRKDNPEQARKIARDYQINRKKRDPTYKLRKYISTAIYSFLRKNGAQKNGSIMDYLPYSIIELKQHLESLFEPWMSWNNMKKYDPQTWDDNDPTTWTWNIDHIIPQSKLLYTSMTDKNFIKSWSLNNLRPYSSKLNISEGNRR